MTWIVGAAPPIGYAVGISDIRVTFSDGTERDCVQKLYPISNYIATGFAGSVQIGFFMLEALRFRLKDLPDGAGWVPDDVANDMADVAKVVFSKFNAEEQEGRCHLMLLGAHPTEDVGIPGYARTSVHILRSPDFTPEKRVGDVVSIGSGSDIQEYKAVLEGFSGDVLTLMRGEMMGAGKGFLPLSIVMQKVVQKQPIPGISPHTHVCVVRRGGIQVNTNDHDVYPKEGEKVEFRMPSVATSWDEFVCIASADNNSPQHATC